MEFYQMSAETLPQIHFVDDTTIVPPYIHKRRRAGEYIMYVVKQGEMYLTEDDIPLILRAGDICILDKDRMHAGVKASTCSYYYIHFTHKDFELLQCEEREGVIDFFLKQRIASLKSDIFSYDECRGGKIYLPKHWHAENTGTLIRLSELLEQAKQENYSPLENYKTMCACCIQQVFIEISRSFLTSEHENYKPGLPGYYYKVQQILEYLNREYGGEISGVLLERELSGNFDYMNRIFKKVTGQTIFQYLTQVRIKHAAIMIRNTTMKMSEIGKKTGFPDEYYFSRVFKKHMGMSPAAYGKTMAKSQISVDNDKSR